MRKKSFKLTVITPFYNEVEGGVIDEYFKTVIPVLKKLTPNYEIICIDDGSKDDTYRHLQKYKDEHVHLIKLSRNFGKEAALTAGLEASDGDCVIPIDADLQHPVSLFPKMIELWQGGVDMVMPHRQKRDEGLIKKLTAYLFYKLMRLISSVDIPDNVGDFRLFDKKVVSAICQMKEKNRFMKGLMSYPGFTTAQIEYVQKERQNGTVKQNYKKLWALAFDGIFSFSVAPIRMVFVLAFFIGVCSLIWASWIFYQKIFLGIRVSGYASLMVAILFLNSMVLFGLGIIGEYIGRIYTECKGRPIYFIEKQEK